MQKGGHRVVPPGAAPIQFPAGRVNEGQGRLTEGQLLKLVLRLGIRGRDRGLQGGDALLDGLQTGVRIGSWCAHTARPRD